MSLGKKLFSQTAIYGTSSIIGRFLNYLLVPLYTAAFTTAEFGVVTEMYAYVSFFIVLLTYGMETAYFRYMQTHESTGRVFSTVLRSILTSSLVFLLIAWLVAPTVAEAIRYPGHAEYIRWFAIVLAADAISSIPFARLRQEKRPMRFAFLKLLSIFTNIALNLFFILFCPYVLKSGGFDSLKPLVEKIYDPSVGVGYVFIANVASSLIVLPFMAKELADIRKGFDAALWKELMRYAIPLLFVGFAGMINETLDRVLLKYMLPEASAMRDLGIYGACYKLSILMTLFIQAYRFAAEPFFFEQMKNADARVTYARTMNYFVIACCVIFFGVMAYIDVFKLFLRNQEMYEGLHIVPILLLANLFLGIHYNLSVWYRVTDQTRAGAWISVSGALVTVVLNLALIPWLGYEGSAWATLVCYFFMAALNYLLGQRYYTVPYQLGRITTYLLITLLMYGASWWLRTHFETWVNYSVSTLLLLIFMALALISERQNKNITLPA